MTPALQRLLLFHVVTSLWQHAPGSEIIHGQKAPANSLLYVVSLQDNYGTHRCGGSLINDNFVLTAAHCESPGMPARVLLGTHNLRGGGTVRGIAQVCKHPSFRGVSTGDDIMLLKLSQKVPIGGRIQSIRLPPPNTHIRANQKCRVAGWGWSESTHDVDDEVSKFRPWIDNILRNNGC